MKISFLDLLSCGGCQFSILSEDETLFHIMEKHTIVKSSYLMSHDSDEDCDITFVEGAVSDENQADRLRAAREKSRLLVSMGSCAVHGGTASMGNIVSESGLKVWSYDTDTFEGYPEGLAQIVPPESIVEIDYHLSGCPVTVSSFDTFIRIIENDSKPQSAVLSVCSECLRKERAETDLAKGFPKTLSNSGSPKESICLLAQGYICLGSVSRGGCGALCPSSYGTPCTGCRGIGDRIMRYPFHETKQDMIKKIAYANRTRKRDLEEGIGDDLRTFYLYTLGEPVLRRRHESAVNRLTKRKSD